MVNVLVSKTLSIFTSKVGKLESSCDVYAPLTLTTVQPTRVETCLRLLEEGKALYQQGSAESLRQAIQKLQEARLLYRAVGDSEALRRNRGVEATTLNNIGAVYNALGEKQKALDYYNQALPISRAVGDKYLDRINYILFIYQSFIHYGFQSKYLCN